MAGLRTYELSPILAAAVTDDMMFSIDKTTLSPEIEPTKHLSISEAKNLFATSGSTIGIGGDYTTLKLFLENTDNEVVGEIISNITETANSTLNASRVISNIEGYTIDFGNFHVILDGFVFTGSNLNLEYADNDGLFDFQTDGSQLRLYGNCSIEVLSTTNNNCVIRQIGGHSTNLTSSRLLSFEYLFFISNTTFSRCAIAYNSADDNVTQNVYGQYLHVSEVGVMGVREIWVMPNALQYGYIKEIFVKSAVAASMITGIRSDRIRGDIISMGLVGILLRNVIAKSIYAPTANYNYTKKNSFPVLDNITVDVVHLTIDSFTLYMSNIVCNTLTGGGTSGVIYIDQSKISSCVKLSKFIVSDSEFSADLRNQNNDSIFSNCPLLAFVFLSGSAIEVQGLQVSNSSFPSISIPQLSNNHVFSNVKTTGSVVISGSNNTFSSSRAGNTITVNATADKTIFDSNRTGTVIVDNGTNTLGLGTGSTNTTI